MLHTTTSSIGTWRRFTIFSNRFKTWFQDALFYEMQKTNISGQVRRWTCSWTPESVFFFVQVPDDLGNHRTSVTGEASLAGQHLCPCLFSSRGLRFVRMCNWALIVIHHERLDRLPLHRFWVRFHHHSSPESHEAVKIKTIFLMEDFFVIFFSSPAFLKSTTLSIYWLEHSRR